MKCVPGWPVRRFSGYSERKIDIFFALTFQRRSGETVWGGSVSAGFGVKIVRFCEGIRDSSNEIIHTGW